MDRGFQSRPDGGVEGRLHPLEVDHLAHLASELLALLDSEERLPPPAGAAAPPGRQAPPGRRTGTERRGRDDSSVDQLAALVGGFGPTEPPADPALARLLPDAYADDPRASADFRRYTEPDLRAGKRRNAMSLLTSLAAMTGRITAERRAAAARAEAEAAGEHGEPGPGGYPDRAVPISLTAEEARAWLATLNDLRLVLGTRLGITQDGQSGDDLDPDDPRAVIWSVYSWLTWLQDTLVAAVLPADG